MHIWTWRMKLEGKIVITNASSVLLLSWARKLTVVVYYYSLNKITICYFGILSCYLSKYFIFCKKVVLMDMDELFYLDVHFCDNFKNFYHFVFLKFNLCGK